MGPCSGQTRPPPSPRRGSQIFPKAYDKTERLGLDFWDPRRLASHVLATLSPVDQRTAAVSLILEMRISGSFLACYTCQIEELLPVEDCVLVRAIARTIPKTFWVPQREPRDYDRYNLRDIVSDLESGASRVEEEHAIPSVAEFAAPCWVYEEDDEAEVEVEQTEEDKPLPELPSGGQATLVKDDHKVELGAYNDEAGRGDNRVIEGGESHAGDDDHEDICDGSSINVLRSLWAQISLSVHAGYRRHTTGGSAFLHWGSHFLGDLRHGDETEHEHIAMTSWPRRGRAGVSSSTRGGGSESTVVHSWMLRCIGLYGL